MGAQGRDPVHDGREARPLPAILFDAATGRGQRSDAPRPRRLRRPSRGGAVHRRCEARDRQGGRRPPPAGVPQAGIGRGRTAGTSMASAGPTGAHAPLFGGLSRRPDRAKPKGPSSAHSILSDCWTATMLSGMPKCSATSPDPFSNSDFASSTSKSRPYAKSSASRS